MGDALDGMPLTGLVWRLSMRWQAASSLALMAPDKVREALRMMPFRAFTVEVAGGKRIHVKHPDYAQLSPAGRTLVVFTNDKDAMEIIDVFLITNLSYDSRQTARRK